MRAEILFFRIYFFIIGKKKIDIFCIETLTQAKFSNFVNK